MKKLRILLQVAVAQLGARLSFAWARRRYPAAVVLANELAGIRKHGVETFQVDPGQSVPVTNSYIGGGKYLIYQIGAANSATTRTAQVCGGAATKAGFPLGISDDAPYQAGDWLDVSLFGAAPGTKVGISAGAISDQDWVGSAANGLVQSLATAGAGTYWLIGKATKTVSGAGQQVSFADVTPYLVTVTAGNPNTYAVANPV